MTTPAGLMDTARTQTGLSDFGPGDFREGLEVYWDSVMSEAHLNEVGAMAVQATLVGSLVNRLKIVDWTQSHPDLAGESIEAPVFVIGMFRAGTTLLSNLFDQDSRNRPLLRWESADSVPPPTPETFRSGPRVDAARIGGEMLESLNPKIAIVHHEDANGPTECIAVMSQDFKSLALEAIANVPTYGRWLQEVDQRSAYEYHRLVLRVLQSGGVRGRWTLKSPHHAIALEALTAVYPDARLILLHRDPVLLCGSVCSLISTLSGTFSDDDHSKYIAHHWTDMLETSIDRLEAFRAAHPTHPILDVQYDDLIRSPVETVARMYDFIGDYLSTEVRLRLDTYVSANRQGQFGVHRYDLADFGLDRAEIADRFGAYTARYQIPVQG